MRPWMVAIAAILPTVASAAPPARIETERHVVAVSTVKWHINNLYAKLNVHSRTLAIARARELGLLQTMHSVGTYQSRSL